MGGKRGTLESSGIHKWLKQNPIDSDDDSLAEKT